MRFTRLAWVIGLVVLAGLCTLGAIGFTSIIPVLITLAVLVVMVAGGNLLSGRAP